MNESEAWEVVMQTLDACRDDLVAFNDLFLDRPRYDPDPTTRQYQTEICRSVVRYGTTVCFTGNWTGAT
jgi:hypothetical protein